MPFFPARGVLELTSNVPEEKKTFAFRDECIVPKMFHCSVNEC